MGDTQTLLFVAGEHGLAGLGHFAQLRASHSRHVVTRSGFFIARAAHRGSNVALSAQAYQAMRDGYENES